MENLTWRSLKSYLKKFEYYSILAIIYNFRVWKALRKRNPRLRVHISTEGRHKNELMFQQRAPVKSVVYDTPYNKVII